MRLVKAAWIPLILAASAVAFQVQPEPDRTYVPAEQTAPTGPETPQLSDQELDQLLGAIALYPDPLIAPILTGSMYPLDVVAADQWLKANPNPGEDAINAQPWDPSIKILLHYPSVMDQLAGNVSWTQQLGAAFHDQPQAVMNSIQRLRKQAQDAGNLASSPQETVTTVDDAIRILPPSPDVVYVPYYSPAVVYVRHDRGWHGSLYTWSAGYGIGDWLDLDCDWWGRTIVVGGNWHRPGIRRDIRIPPNAHRWEPPREHPVQIRPHFSPPAQRGWDRGPERPAAPFHPDAPRRTVERDEKRGRESMKPQPPPRPAPARPTPKPESPRPAQPAPRPAQPAPRPAPPAPRPAEPARPSPPAPHPSPPGRGPK